MNMNRGKRSDRGSTETPRTEAGRRIFDEKPIGWTGQDWRAAVLAIEREAAAARPAQPLYAERDRLFNEIDKRFGRTVARFVYDRLAPPERPEADDD